MVQTEKFNKKIYNNIKNKMLEKEINLNKMADTLETSAQNLCKKLKKLEKGTGITTSSLFDIAFALGTTVEELIK